jgi:protein tyrosine phosphatase (PTP) superfamily phosphohydrolase (DUF442 family)
VALLTLAGVLVVVGAREFIHTKLRYRFTTVDAGRVYSSAAIPPDQLPDVLKRHGIRTVIDLRDPKGRGRLCPEKAAEIAAEAAAIAVLPGVRHVSIPSPQVPTPATLAVFFATLDDPDAYPVLIHCYHGTGRAMMYAALYRIEYLGMSNDAARRLVRPIVELPGYRSGFARGRPKGDFLLAYRPRRATATLPTDPAP